MNKHANAIEAWASLSSHNSQSFQKKYIGNRRRMHEYCHLLYFHANCTATPACFRTFSIWLTFVAATVGVILAHSTEIAITEPTIRICPKAVSCIQAVVLCICTIAVRGARIRIGVVILQNIERIVLVKATRNSLTIELIFCICLKASNGYTKLTIALELVRSRPRIWEDVISIWYC